MKRTKLYLLSLIFLILLLTGSACGKATKTKPSAREIPTLIFHGLGGSYKDELPLARGILKEKRSNKVIRANVNEHGKVKLLGKIKSKSKNPVVLVNYKDNVQPNFERNGLYATHVVMALQKKYDFKKINMVGYSLGNISIIYYQLLHENKPNMPKLNKQVNIAGHFDGANFPELPAGYRSPNNLQLNKQGKPNKRNATYRQMLKVRPMYQKQRVQVLNLIGDSGNHSDGVVENNSSRSLRYLVADKNYHEKIFYGPKASHRNLFKNTQVIRSAIEFLW